MLLEDIEEHKETIEPVFFEKRPSSGNFDPDQIFADLLRQRFGERESHEIFSALKPKFDNVQQIIRSSRSHLAAITPKGEEVYDELERLRKLATLFSRLDHSQEIILDNCQKTAQFCRLLMAAERREVFHILLLDKSLRMTGDICLQEGTIDHVAVYPREVFRQAFEHGASHLILLHNHPSGNCKPSRQDVRMTRTLAKLGHSLGVLIADHIIIGRNGEFSFRTNGLEDALEPVHCLHSLAPSTASL